MAVSVILVLHNNSLFLDFNQLTKSYDIKKYFKQVLREFLNYLFFICSLNHTFQA